MLAVLDGLDREAVVAVRAAAPEVIVHEMTALADMRSLRNVDRVFAATNELRTRHRQPAGGRGAGGHSPGHRAKPLSARTVPAAP